MTSIPIQELQVSAYRVPTDAPEADGTLEWDSTTLVLVRAWGGDHTGLGWTYGHQAVATLIRDKLAGLVMGRDAQSPPAAWEAMVQAIRNQGRPGIASMAVSAVDTALWDLKARLLDLPLCALWGGVRERVPVYGSGGFTSYSESRLREQLEGWVREGIPRVKMKVGSRPDRDPARVRVAREAIGEAELFVDANGAYDRKQALALARDFARQGVTWFEEPVSSDDLEGLRLLRDQGPPGLEISAGEYGYDVYYFRRMLQAGSVDVLQADATRCGGFSGFMRAAELCRAWGLPLSAHCAPALHRHLGCSVQPLRHLEWFHDHVRIESLFFDGAPRVEGGCLAPDLSRPGLGLELKSADAEPYRI